MVQGSITDKPPKSAVQLLREECARIDRVDRAAAEIEERERAVKGREIARREQRQDTFDADAASMDGDAPADQTLADFTVAFTEGVDLTPLPAVVERNDGETVLYSGKLNWVFGLPGSGKSWVSLIAIDFAVARGGNVLIMDFEDSAATFQRRAALVGFSPAVHPDNFRYARPGLADAPTAVKEAQAWLADAPDGTHSLVVIDAAESSGCPSDGADVNPWLAKMVTPWRDVGAGVLVVDHIPKRSEDRPNGPIGSQRKLAAVDGAALAISGLPWTKAKGGYITLKNHKDRGGDLPAPVGKAVAVIEGAWSGTGDTRGFRYTIAAPTEQEDTGSMANLILDAVVNAGPDGVSSLKRLRGLVQGKNGPKDAAIEELINAGHMERVKGAQGNVYTATGQGINWLTQQDAT